MIAMATPERSDAVANTLPFRRTARPSALTDELVTRYAPLLRFSKAETHFPIDPATFIRHARLRRYGWSDDIRDAVWHPRRACWEAAFADLPASPGSENPDIAEACRLIQFEARGTGGDVRNRRPCDPQNLWYGRRAGYALELAEPQSGDLRGVPGEAPALYFDRYSVPTHAGVFDVISYWFFFALSPSATAHEGDWQSVSVMIPDDGSEIGVRFDAPRGCLACGFGEAELVDGTHPVALVEAGAHGLFRSASEMDSGAGAHNVLLRSWELAPRRVPTLAWSSFDGAWGRVGAGPRTTGPLGPLFRRDDLSREKLA